MESKYSFSFSPLAEKELDAVIAYISETLCNGKAAVDLLDKLNYALGMICTFPYSSADCKIFLITDEKVRHVLVDNYVLVYEIMEEEKHINVLRFCYTRMDLRKLIF